MPDLKIDANFSDFDSITEKINELTTRASDKKLIRSISPKRILKKAGIKNMGKTVIRGEKARDSFTGI
jgi:tetrahydromethanopterin S-methyltransferase subunit B